MPLIGEKVNIFYKLLIIYTQVRNLKRSKYGNFYANQTWTRRRSLPFQQRITKENNLFRLYYNIILLTIEIYKSSSFFLKSWTNRAYYECEYKSRLTKPHKIIRTYKLSRATILANVVRTIKGSPLYLRCTKSHIIRRYVSWLVLRWNSRKVTRYYSTYIVLYRH